MGEVHRARDTRLDRTVAIKVLQTGLADKPDLRERFEREARAVSSLNHARICALYDVGEQDGIQFLVMEYLDGETLAKRIHRGPLPLEEALRYAAEIADALDKAHRQGIVHRDLKPGNVMITKSGTKLLDFGLARLKQANATPVFSSNSLPTNVSALTGQGTILGTLQYMAPEQLEGKDADARTDIFAFGSLIYEMVTGRPAFEGKSQVSLIAAILEREPAPITALQPTSPRSLDRLIRRCLAKDPDERWQTAADLCAELKWIGEGTRSDTATDTSSRPGAKPSRNVRIWMVIAALLFVSTAVSSIALLWKTRQVVQPDTVSFVVNPPEKTAFAVGGLVVGTPSGIISPDGRKIAFTAQDTSGRVQLWIRPLDSVTARPLAGTDAAALPFWSPDSRWIAFFAQGKLKKIDIAGGAPQTLCDAPNSRGGAWNRDGAIIFAPNNPGPLSRVSAGGGEPVPLTKLTPAQTNHRLPNFFPDGTHFLYFAAGAAGSSILVGTLESGESQPLLSADSPAIYAPPSAVTDRAYSSGYLLFARQSTLFAQSFDAARLRLQGDPVPIAEQVANDGITPGFSVSENGILIYRTGTSGQDLQLAWLDRSGKLIEKIGTPASYRGPNISPDGKRIAVHRHEGGGGDIWIFEAGRGTMSRFTFDASQDSSMPVWSPDGKRIVFGSLRKNKWGIYVKQADGTGNEELLVESDNPKMPMSWSRDGRFIVYWVTDPKTSSDAWAIPMNGDRKPFPVLQTSFNEQWPELSPDGKWIAYTSNETGSAEIYIKQFPTGAGKWQVSTNGGVFCRWRGDGKELYYLSTAVGGKMMAAEIHVASSSLEAGAPRALFDSGYANAVHTTNYHTYAVSADGQRFLIPRPDIAPPGDTSFPINVVLNWTSLLNRK